MNRHNPHALTSAFASPDALSDLLSGDIASVLLASVGDVAFVLDADGVIVDCAVSNPELLKYGFADWVGRAWIDTVSTESRMKIEELLSHREDGAAMQWRQVNHPTAAGDIPIRYLLSGAGSAGRAIAIGRDMLSASAIQQRLLQAQQSLERDYVRLRQAEARYRLLFDMASEPVLIVDASSRRITEANGAAERLLGVKQGALANQPVTAILEAADRETFIAHLGAIAVADDVPPVVARLVNSGAEASFSARLFRQGRSALVLVRFDLCAAPSTAAAQDVMMGNIIDKMPDAFVLADGDLRIIAANEAFVEMSELPMADRVVGESLGNWLGRPGIDLDLITAQLRDHGSVRNVATIVRGAAGGQEDVEVSAVMAPMDSGPYFGFSIRNVGRRVRDTAPAELDLPRSVDQLTELVGRMPLKDIVRESTDLIERLCIEAALTFTSDNRASAAEILGLSRQSLYSKLHRHGLGNLIASPE
ncbi:transcriptional regulator PpsR [Sphingobium algorifonticola]|uniref:Transcriptional regulator PpsR n=1 Tax=Sphingobium algorifonticola TaxID=2008318 RepID=A0A437J5J5_9SPHN|nr:transcriptional regulator PpsR [Sphingobium algorifonticola]RVT40208.1 transcriptional regulator PpsR [Sphingobium algorifonticola]